MYTSYIGKKFLKYYNEKEKKNYTAREYFDEVMFPVFFNNERHLLHVGNSSFFQPVPQREMGEKDINIYRLERFHKDVEDEPPNMATYVGFAAKDICGTTSGQVTDIAFQINEEEMYASWIGQSLGIGVSGGFIIAFDDAEVLYNINKGAKYYREYLNKTPNIKDKQIETWNGHWLNHYYDEDFEPGNIWSNFNLETKDSGGTLSIPTILWSKVIFTLAKLFPNREITVYSYNLSQTNTTLGFIKVFLPQIERMFEFRDALFINEKKSALSDKQIKSLEPFWVFKEVCRSGTIGLNSIEPKGLREYLPVGSYNYSRGKELKITEKTYSTFLIYKLWVIAMLNKTELLKLAEKLANVLVGYNTNKAENARGKTTKSREISDLLESRNMKLFIENLTKLMENFDGNKALFKEVVEEVLKMPVDNLPLFVTLIKFEYNYQLYQGE